MPGGKLSSDSVISTVQNESQPAVTDSTIFDLTGKTIFDQFMISLLFVLVSVAFVTSKFAFIDLYMSKVEMKKLNFKAQRRQTL